jgi:hypothetical protein
MIRTFFRPVARLAHLFFRSQLKLRLRGGLRLEWVDRDATGPLSPAAQRAAREQAELDLMLRELTALLDEDPDIRDSLRHLVFVEQALAQQGLSALQQVPVTVLRKGLDQFEGLVTNWGPRGLASLRSRMSVAVSMRGQEDDDAVALSAAPPARQARVTES